MKKMIANILTICLFVSAISYVTYCGTPSRAVGNPVAVDGTAWWDCIYFGNYPQSDATGQKSEPIKWRVLSVDGQSAFIMADANLDNHKFGDDIEEGSWEKSSLREWLNTYFINKAFTEEEQNYILESKVENRANALYDVGGSDDTLDKIYVLSEAEATNESYGFSVNYEADAGRVRKNTAYVSAGGFMKDDMPNVEAENSADWYWLRTSGEEFYQAVFVLDEGDISRKGDVVYRKNSRVCPVLNINLDNDMWSYAGKVSSDGEVTFEEPTEKPTENLTDKPTEEPTENLTDKPTEKPTEEPTESKSETPKEEKTKAPTEKVTTAVAVRTSGVPNQKATTKKKSVQVAKTRIIKATKKKKAKTVNVKIKKVKKVLKYEVAFYSNKKCTRIVARKKVKKASTAIKNKKFAKSKKLYVRVRVYKRIDGKTYKSKWSKAVKVKIK